MTYVYISPLDIVKSHIEINVIYLHSYIYVQFVHIYNAFTLVTSYLNCLLSSNTKYCRKIFPSYNRIVLNNSCIIFHCSKFI